MKEHILSTQYKLTQYSHGAGCGCKISPKILSKILEQSGPKAHFPTLLVGNEDRDDAAVIDLGDGTAIVSTTDFFMPIVDDAFDFGRIASVNAISDIYAMGATPLMAIAILGWPVNQLPAAVAQRVLEGARQVCTQANIPLAGGHSIDSPEPIFGLAVTGKVPTPFVKKNKDATAGCLLFLTKPLGVGILSTAQKKGKLLQKHQFLARDSMVQLNDIGIELAQKPFVLSMTDVTGFGLLGHLIEMCEASQLSARINSDRVPLLSKEVIDYYLLENCIPGGTHRNFDSYGHKVSTLTDQQKAILCDPQTSGGLLLAVDPKMQKEFTGFMTQKGFKLESFGEMIEKKKLVVMI